MTYHIIMLLLRKKQQKRDKHGWGHLGELYNVNATLMVMNLPVMSIGIIKRNIWLEIRSKYWDHSLSWHLNKSILLPADVS